MKEKLDKIRKLAEEAWEGCHGCDENDKNFWMGGYEAAALTFMPEDSHPIKNLYIIRGVPGSGKSTLAKLIVGSDFLVCEADKYFYNDEGVYKFEPSLIKEAHKYCKELVESYMKDSLLNDQFYRNIAVSNTFTQEWEMEPYFELAHKYGYRVFSLIVENRHGHDNIHGAPEETVQRMRDRFEFKL